MNTRTLEREELESIIILMATKEPILFSGGAARLPDQELHQRLEQRHLPERPPRLLQAGHDAQLGQAQSARWVSESQKSLQIC